MRLISFSPTFFFGISNHYFSYEEKELCFDKTGWNVYPSLIFDLKKIIHGFLSMSPFELSIKIKALPVNRKGLFFIA